MSLFEPTPIERLVRLHGSFLVYARLSADEQRVLGAPQFQVGQVVTVLNPWWHRDRDGIQRKTSVRCRVVEAPGYFHWRGDGGSYSLDVREEVHPGSHGRMISEKDVEGFVPNPLYSPA